MRPAPTRSIRPMLHGRRAWPALGVVLAVLLLHAALLGLLPQRVGGPAPGAARVTPRPLQVRQVELPALAPALGPARVSALGPALVSALTPAPVPAPVPAPLPPPAREAAQAPPPQPLPRPSRSAAARVPEPPAPLPDLTPQDLPAAAAAAVAAAAAAAAADTAAKATSDDALAGAPEEAGSTAWPAGTPLPTYATRLPPPATLQYTVQRGGGPGAGAMQLRDGLQAQLIWRPDTSAATYTLSLGLGAAGSASVGALDLHGIAPERHVETRRGREVRAANFQRQAGEGGGRISFSGPRIEHPLLPGVQDRLSWMLQLPGVLAADPALGQPGRELTLLVVGVRGDAALWTFRVMAVRTLPLPAGEVLNAVHLRREAPGPYDTRVDVWLDPARHHLPVRLRLQYRADGPGTEFELLRLTP